MRLRAGGMQHRGASTGRPGALRSSREFVLQSIILGGTRFSRLACVDAKSTVRSNTDNVAVVGGRRRDARAYGGTSERCRKRPHLPAKFLSWTMIQPSGM